MGAIALIGTANGALFWGVSGACYSGKFLRLKFSKMQPSAFWTLKFSKCLDSILNIRHTFTKEKIPGQKGGPGPPGSTLKSALVTEKMYRSYAQQRRREVWQSQSCKAAWEKRAALLLSQFVLLSAASEHPAAGTFLYEHDRLLNVLSGGERSEGGCFRSRLLASCLWEVFDWVIPDF